MAATDAEIIQRSGAEPGQFALVFERHFDAIHRYLARRVGAELADDLAAQVFAEAFNGRGRYDLSRPDAVPWLYGIAANLLRRHHRTERRQLRAYARLGSDPVAPDDLGPLVDRLDAQASGRRLAAALAALSGKDRDVLLLYAWAELSYADIAYALGIPVGTVRSRLNRARRRMRELLGLDGQEEGREVRALADVEVADGRA